jgi:hypothetical protein
MKVKKEVVLILSVLLFVVCIIIFLIVTLIRSTKKSSFTDNKETIPKVIHKIFIDSEMKQIKIDTDISNAMDTWVNLNPGYKLKLWYGNDCRQFLIDNYDSSYVECFDRIIPYAYKTDFMRYCIIYKEGGWYSDWQQRLLLPLGNLENYSWVSCWDTTGDENIKYKCMQNGFFGSYKNNRILKECISTIIKNCKDKNYGLNPWFPTGPCLLGESFRKVNPDPATVNIGYTVNDKDDGPCFIIDAKKMIINKCCLDVNKPATTFKNGNNYIELWNSKNIYN